MESLKGMMASDDSALKELELDEKLQQALKEDGVDADAIRDELKSLDDGLLDHSKTTLRARLERILESTPLEVFLVVLVIVDVVILLVMLLMDLNILHLHLVDINKAAKELTGDLRDNCVGNTELQHYNDSNLVTVARLLDSGGCVWKDPHNNTLVDHSHHRQKRAAGPPKEGENPTIGVLIEAAHVLHIASIVILAIMVVEVVLKIFALGLKYFKGKLEVIDGIVIFISFAMDLYFIDGVAADGVNNGATVLVIFLLWRILRVFNALLVTAKKRLQFRIRVQKRMRRILEDKLEVVDDDIKNLENHIENLIRLAKRHSLPDYEIKACKPLVKQLSRANTSAGLASMMQMSMGLMHGMNNMKGVERQRGAIAENLRNPPNVIVETNPEPTVSEVLSSAMTAAENSNKIVDVVHDSSNTVLPVPVIAALAVGSHEGSPVFSRSDSMKSQGKEIPGVEFTKAVAIGKPDNNCISNGTALRSWNHTSKTENNNAKLRSNV